MGQITITPVELFYSYAHEDEWLRNELEQHLSGLKRQGYLTEWHDRLLQPGTNWQEEIDEHLNTAHIIVLLISPSFLASDYCYGFEMKRAMERHQAREAYVLPILLRPVYWSDIPLSKLQALPSNHLPVVSWNNRDEAFVNVVQGIRQVIIARSTAINQVAAPVKALYAFSLKAEAAPPVSTIPSDPWSKFGLTGEIIGTYAHSQQWGQAESAARQIANERQRAQVLSQLVLQLAEAQQWERAEAIAHSLAYPYHDDALMAFLKVLTIAQQWERAEALIRSLTFMSNQAAMFNDLSRSLLKAGYADRAQRLMYEADAIQATPPTTTRNTNKPHYNSGQTSRSAQLPSSLSPAVYLVTVLIIIALSFIAFLLINHTLSVIPVVWLIIGILAIGGVIIFTLRRRRRH